MAKELKIYYKCPECGLVEKGVTCNGFNASIGACGHIDKNWTAIRGFELKYHEALNRERSLVAALEKTKTDIESVMYSHLLEGKIPYAHLDAIKSEIGEALIIAFLNRWPDGGKE